MRLLASLLCLAPLLAHICCKDVFGVVGENFTFPVQIDEKIVETVWKRNKDKVAEWEGHNKPTYFSPLYNRSVLMEDGSLTIVNLEKNDSGTYELEYWDSVKIHNLTFILYVLDFLPEPKIICNTTESELVLNCIAHFQGSLNYAWKLSDDPHIYRNQELFIPLKNVDATTKATCIIKFSQTERSSEISLNQCRPEEKGNSSFKRSRGILIGFIITSIIVLGILAFLHWKGLIKCGAGSTAQNNSPVNGSGEHDQLFPGNSQQQPNSEGGEHDQLFPGNSQQQPNSEGVAFFLRAAHCEDEEPEADRHALRTDSANSNALKDEQIVENGINQEEVTKDAEGGNEEHLNNSSSCIKEDLKA